jgi:dCMP deaminase
MSSRPDWDQYFLNLAAAAATRATCDRAKVGCVLVRDNRIISTGYNASISGHAHCDDAGHIIVNNSCIRAAHAEENAVITAAKFGTSIADTTAYTTHFPCWRCFRMLANAGITRIVFLNIKISDMTAEILDEYLASSIMIENGEGATLTDLKQVIIQQISNR